MKGFEWIQKKPEVPKDWRKEAEKVLRDFDEENKNLDKSAKGILGQNLMAKIAGEIAKEETTGDKNEAKQLAQELAIVLDEGPDTGHEEAKEYLYDYLHPEEAEKAA